MTAITWKITDQFFDKRVVMSASERANKRCLSLAGSDVRRIARRSIKPVRKTRGGKSRSKNLSSLPGQPPRSHTNGTSKNLRLILYGYVPQRQSVIVGPVKFNNRSGVNVPSVLEHGGRTRVKRFVRVGRKTRVRKATARVAPRPYMMPALVKAAPNFAKLWKNTVGRV